VNRHLDRLQPEPQFAAALVEKDGADEVIAKPVDADELLCGVNRHVR
jgi:hypothetical protein